MDKLQIPAETSIPFVRLKVTDINRSLEFYEDKLGLKAANRFNGTTSLSANGLPPCFLFLTEAAHAGPKPARSAGLYHLALRLPTRADLANTLKRLLAVEWHFYNTADHGVSEALYTSDPDGNGLEFYADRQVSRWQKRGGYFGRSTRPLDINDLLGACNNGLLEKIPADTRVGHIHLQVADLDSARRFYRDLLGLSMAEADYPGTLFFSSDGNRHLVGVYAQEGGGALPPEETVGLVSFGLRIPSGRVFQAIRQRLENSKVPIQEKRENGILVSLQVKDPAGNTIELLM